MCAFSETKSGYNGQRRVATVRHALEHEKERMEARERSCASQYLDHDDVHDEVPQEREL